MLDYGTKKDSPYFVVLIILGHMVKLNKQIKTIKDMLQMYVGKR